MSASVWIPDNTMKDKCSVCERTFDSLRSRRIHEAHTHNLKVKRNPTRSFREHPQTHVARRIPTARELEWAAGYLEGEGCFVIREYAAPRKPVAEVTAGSTDLEPLQALHALFGGMLRPRKLGPKAKRPFFWTWAVYGSRALGVAQTLYLLMCPRRRLAIQAMLVKSKEAYA